MRVQAPQTTGHSRGSSDERHLHHIRVAGPNSRQQTADSRQQTADSRQQTADSRQQTADSRQQTADSRQQTADSRQQTADSRQQTADSRQQTAGGIALSMTGNTTITCWLFAIWQHGYVMR
ncbi:hypothetical protein MC64_007420 [Aeromonas caviae]|nr:hypothetical protein MC64_007420 [Aeromonas caviae]